MDSMHFFYFIAYLMKDIRGMDHYPPSQDSTVQDKDNPFVVISVVSILTAVSANIEY